MCVNEKHLISWLEREHKEEEMNEAAQSVSSVPRLFAAISIHILFQEGGVHGDACRAWSSPAPPAFTPPPPFWKLPTPGSSGDVITVQSTCKTHIPGECISLIDHSWLLFLTARIRKWLLCSFPLLKCIPRRHNQEKMIVIHKMHVDNQRAGWKIFVSQAVSHSAEAWDILRVKLWLRIQCALSHSGWIIDQRAITCHTSPVHYSSAFYFPGNENRVDTLSLMVLQSIQNWLPQ